MAQNTAKIFYQMLDLKGVIFCQRLCLQGVTVLEFPILLEIRTLDPIKSMFNMPFSKPKFIPYIIYNTFFFRRRAVKWDNGLQGFMPDEAYLFLPNKTEKL